MATLTIFLKCITVRRVSALADLGDDMDISYRYTNVSHSFTMATSCRTAHQVSCDMHVNKLYLVTYLLTDTGMDKETLETLILLWKRLFSRGDHLNTLVAILFLMLMYWYKSWLPQTLILIYTGYQQYLSIIPACALNRAGCINHLLLFQEFNKIKSIQYRCL